jgi:hypothetical protein
VTSTDQIAGQLRLGPIELTADLTRHGECGIHVQHEQLLFDDLVEPRAEMLQQSCGVLIGGAHLQRHVGEVRRPALPRSALMRTASPAASRGRLPLQAPLARLVTRVAAKPPAQRVS